MPDFMSLENAIQRALTLGFLSALGMFAITLCALLFAYQSAKTVHDLGLHRPVLVVPGAVGGIYSPGLTDDQVRATARYLATLASNFTSGTNFTQRFNELESYASPAFLPRLQLARARLQHDVDAQNQARSFYGSPSTESLDHHDAEFRYRISGERTIYASGLPMNHHQSQLTLDLRWGIPSANNAGGIVLDSLSMTDIDSPPVSTTTPGAP
jgi:hypothetical protein